jgi:ABC-type branched-subunit amino acid transport system substrate-binding protein
MGMRPFLIIFLVFASLQGTAQPAAGIKLYEQGNFEAALDIFRAQQDAPSKLFTGKTLFALARYAEAADVLDAVSGDATVGPEARYTLGLSLFQVRNYAAALEVFYLLNSPDVPVDVRNDSKKLYSQILDFLTDRERYIVSQTAAIAAIRTEAASPRPSKTTLPGFSAQVALAVPLVSKEDELYEVSQGLYNGFALAMEQFNEEHRDYKVFIRHINTGQGRLVDTVKAALKQAPVDLVFGPLFSHEAKEMAQFAEQFEIPLLAPLANMDTLSALNPYVFQLNPVFGSRGRAMAHFAVEKMGYDSLTVIAERGSLGEMEALAFVNLASQLGATINYFYLQDLEKRNYDITPFLERVSTDRKLVDSLRIVPSKAVYLPFTGQAAQALIENALTDLEVANPKIAILGSEEWGSAEIAKNLRTKFQIYFTQGFQEPASTKTAQTFRQQYKDRFGANAGRWAFIGYDAGQFISQSLYQVKNPAKLRRSWIDRGLHEGQVTRINFINSNVNKGVRIMKITATGATELR